VFRTDAGIIQAGRDAVNVGGLSVIILKDVRE
jgi:hypothetical protein